jgi:putative DNA primase/helicase
MSDTKTPPSPQYKSKGNLRETATGRWLEILSVLAPELEEAVDVYRSKDMHVPCHGHGGENGFRLLKHVNESGASVCNTCGLFKDGFKTLGWVLAVREAGKTPSGYDPNEWNEYCQQAFTEVAYYLDHGVSNNPELRNRVPRPRITKTPEEIAAEAAAVLARNASIMSLGERMWRNSVAFDPMVNAYFAGRGTPDIEISPFMRFGSQVPFMTDVGIQYKPAILLPISRTDNGTKKIVGLHRIYLEHHDDGRVTKIAGKNAKKMLTWTTDLAGAVIQLYPLNGSESLIITEGVETAAALYTLTGIPAWPGISAWGMQNVQIPDSVKVVLIGADYDKSETGQKAAVALAERVRALGKIAVIMLPEAFYEPGNDAHEKGVDWDDACRSDPELAALLWEPFSIVHTPELSGELASAGA